MPTLQASHGWLANFTERYGIKSYRLNGERGSIDDEAAQAAAILLAIKLVAFCEDNIFNADETALFWKQLVRRTYERCSKQAAGTKMSKDRLTVMLCANASGTEKLPAFVVGKAAKPRALKNVDIASLGVVYKSQRKAWMNKALFHGWLLDWDAKLTRRVCLLLDNFSGHNVDGLVLANIAVEFLPANTTALLQPMDQGIINACKQTFRKRLTQHFTGQYDNALTAAVNAPNLQAAAAALSATVDVQDVAPKVNMKMALEWLAASWAAVTPETINRCFLVTGLFRRPLTVDMQALIVPAEEDDDVEASWTVDELLEDALNPNDDDDDDGDDINFSQTQAAVTMAGGASGLDQALRVLQHSACPLRCSSDLLVRLTDLRDELAAHGRVGAALAVPVPVPSVPLPQLLLPGIYDSPPPSPAAQAAPAAPATPPAALPTAAAISGNDDAAGDEPEEFAGPTSLPGSPVLVGILTASNSHSSAMETEPDIPIPTLLGALFVNATTVVDADDGSVAKRKADDATHGRSKRQRVAPVFLNL